MALEQNLIEQLKGIFVALEHDYTLRITVNNNKDSEELRSLIHDFATSSSRFKVEELQGENLLLEILRNNEHTGINFRAVPTGHEFSSLILAIYNADGKGKNLPDEIVIQKIKRLNKPISLKSYISLTCTNCPEVVQSLNLITVLSGQGVQHTTIDGSLCREEVDTLGISAVPTVYADGEVLHIGQGSLGELLGKLESKYGQADCPCETIHRAFDLIVVGAGPAGCTAAIYSARKGLKVALVAERIGGQVNETTSIENIPSVAHTTGTQLASDLRQHASEYNISILDQRRVERIDVDGKNKLVLTSLGETLEAPQIILATGASWRKLGVQGEAEHIGRGVAFCPHCDGPFFKGKDIAVIGGGNSGVEAAIDLAGICKSVTLLEYADQLKADSVLQDKLRSLDNTQILTGVATQEIIGDGSKVHGLRLSKHSSNDSQTLSLDGVFVQIGLAANTQNFDKFVERNRIGEIVIDERCRTNVEGVYAAGDCTIVPYKQIVIAMGEGAKAALTAFEERIRLGL